jgi:two-component system response regulator YesN
MTRIYLYLLSLLKQSFLNFKNPTFLKILTVFIVAITIPAMGITYFSIRHSTENIVKQVTQSSIKSLSDKKNMLELKFAEFEKVCYQIFNNDDFKSSHGFPDLTFSHLNHLKNFIGYLNNLRFTNDLIDTIYIYDIKNDCIFSGAKYSPADFEDIGIIEFGMKHESSITHRQLNGHDVITYTRHLTDLSNKYNILIIININYNNIFNIGSDRAHNNFDTLIFDDSYSVILLDSQTLPYMPLEIMHDILSTPEEFGVHTIDKTEYFVCKVRSDAIGWNIAYLQPYSEIVLQAQLTSKLILSSLILVLLLSFILACVYSVYLYRPLGKLVSKVSEHIPPDSSEIRDAYKSIDIAVTTLFKENMNLETKYQKVLPYFKLYPINSLLSDGIFDMDKFVDILHLLGIRFVFPHYVNVVIDFENTGFSEREAGMLENTLSKFRGEMAYIVFSVNPCRASTIINTNLNEQEVCRILETVKSELNGQGIELTIAVGALFKDVSNIYNEHRKALALMDNKFFAGKNIIISSKGGDDTSKKHIYDKKLEENLISCICSQDSEGAVQALDLLIENIAANSNSVVYIRIVCQEVIHNIMEALDGFGIDSRKISPSNVDIFENIQNSGTLKELEEYIHGIIAKCIGLVREYREMQHDVIVAKAIEYMKANFNNNIGVDDVARVVYLSPGHLNIIFKAATGSSVYEYITALRMDAAADLLKENGIKIKDIACRVGYNNVQCFQRLFKKYYNMTALEFRRSLLLDEKG